MAPPSSAAGLSRELLRAPGRDLNTEDDCPTAPAPSNPVKTGFGTALTYCSTSTRGQASAAMVVFESPAFFRLRTRLYRVRTSDLSLIAL